MLRQLKWSYAMKPGLFDKIIDRTITSALFVVIATSLAFSAYFYVLAEMNIIDNRNAKAEKLELAKKIKTELECETNK